ncbi:recombinase family protein [Sphaerisporangium sp. NPDC051017]|uniref:recombinase family protein n=1 Tax=Sphaerisporangium sp. NPDC051017 TaxID=3154636 RepID=UPI00343F148B
MPPIREADYARLSKDRRGLSENVTIQLAECADTREESGEAITFVAAFKDNDASISRFGKKNKAKSRVEYPQLLELIRANGIDRLRVTELSRIYRDPSDLEELIQLGDITTFYSIVTTTGAVYDLRTAVGRAALRDYVKVNAYESDLISERAQRKKRSQARQGLPNGGRRSYGYAKDGVTIVEEEAEVIRDIAARLLKGESINHIVRRLNQQQVSTAEGAKWYKPTLINMMGRKRYVGIRVHKDAEYPAIWKGIIDPVIFERVQVALRVDEQLKAQRSNPRKYVLAGFVFCGACGRRLHGTVKQDRPSQPKKARYRCLSYSADQLPTGCGRVTRLAEPLEDLVAAAVITRLDGDDFATFFSDTEEDSTRLRAALDELQAKRQKLTELIGDYYGDNLDQLTREQFMLAKGATETSIANLEGKVEKLSAKRGAAVLPVGQSIRETWLNSDDLGWKRSMIGLVMDKIIVHPGGGKPRYEHQLTDAVSKFDPEQIEIIWKV